MNLIPDNNGEAPLQCFQILVNPILYILGSLCTKLPALINNFKLLVIVSKRLKDQLG